VSLSSSLDLCTTFLEGSLVFLGDSLSLLLEESFLTSEEVTTLGSLLGLGGGEQAGLAILSELLLVDTGLTIDCGLYTGVLLPSPESLPVPDFFLGSGDPLLEELLPLFFLRVDFLGL